MIRVDFSNMLQDSIGVNGLSPDDFKSIDTTALNDVVLKKRAGLDFLDLPASDISDIREMGKFTGKFENFIILGIGGSALGPRSILDALSPFHNLRKKPRVFIYDNVDPMTLHSILDIADLGKSAINVITKSGSTAETIASFMILWRRLEELSLKPAEHIIITTDPEKGAMRRIVREHGLRSLSVPSGVGGRYSVMSAVGLLLAETVGVDSGEMLRGAADIHKACMETDPLKNPLKLFSSGIYLMQKLKSRNNTIMFPYVDRLKSFSEWFCQLWAESLGKDGKGLTPYPSVGTTDQHSQLQLWMQGPQDKVVVFVSVEDYEADFKMPEVFESLEGMAYLSGHSLAELIKIEQEASEIALAKNGRPSITIKLPKVDAYYLGQLFHFFEMATAVTGLLIGINPFDQPGVEEGKNLTYGMMGKHGYEEKRKEFEEYRKGKKFIV